MDLNISEYFDPALHEILTVATEDWSKCLKNTGKMLHLGGKHLPYMYKATSSNCSTAYIKYAILCNTWSMYIIYAHIFLYKAKQVGHPCLFSNNHKNEETTKTRQDSQFHKKFKQILVVFLNSSGHTEGSSCWNHNILPLERVAVCSEFPLYRWYALEVISSSFMWNRTFILH